MSHVGRIARQTGLLTAAQFGGLGVSLIGTIIVARTLGPEGRAVYAWLLTLVGVAIQLALVTPPALVRVVAASPPPRLIATLVSLCLAGALLTTPLAAYVLLDEHIGPEARPFLLLAWLAVPLTATTLALTTFVQIEARIWPVVAVHVLPRVLQTAVIAGLAWVGLLDLQASIAIFTATAVVELLFALGFLWPRIDTLRPSLSVVRSLLALLGAGWLSSVALFAVPRIGLLVLGSYAPLDTTGRYSVALTLQEAALVAPAALGGVLITHVGRHGWFGPAMQARGGGSVLAISVAMCGIAALVAPEFIRLAFGPAFAPAAGAFRILLVAVVLATVYQLCQPLLYARQNPIQIAGPSLAACLVALTAALLAVPTYGVLGALVSNVAGFATLVLVALGFALPRGRPIQTARS